ncbi:MAG TPA: glycosyltransferase family 4 protein [Opitutaceae bacterium]|nr:glycosyltransferase family 4 protein [Opitutaceae bacterium]
MNAADMFRHELETPGPLQAPAGRLFLKGWCCAPGFDQAPAVRLICGTAAVAPRVRPERVDVAAALGLSTTARACGFEFVGELAPGVYLAKLEASLDGAAWHCVRRFSLVATTAPLRGSIEYPTTPTVGESVRIQGWCAHPQTRIRELHVHYGNRRIPCEIGLPRTDIGALAPTSPDVSRAGFITTKNIPVGHGALRLCARDEHGRRHFLATDRVVDVRTDEENPSPLDLAADAFRITPRRASAETLPPNRAARPHRVLFALYGDMTSNSALHVAALANELIARGHECIVAVPKNADTVRYHHGAKFRCVDFAGCGERAALFAGAASPDFVHAWTTSERVRRFATATCDATGARLVIHLEDHEGSIFAASEGRSEEELAALPAAALDRLVGDDHSHPLRRTEFLQRADGCTVILDRLAELLPPGKPSRVLWPAAAPEFCARPIPWPLREALGWSRDHTVLFYHGNLHPTNRGEMAELYGAVVALNDSGTPTTLLRAGRDFCALPDGLANRAAPHVLALGRVDRQEHLAPLLSLADCFVQPGSADTFNNYRFPSKLPEFFASGRPVILPRTNLGEHLRDGVDAVVLEHADAAGIADAVRRLRNDPALAAQLGSAAAEFARTRFSWARSADTLAEFYDALLAADRR